MKVHICSFFTSSCFLHIVWCYYNEFQTRLQAEKDKVSRVIKKPNRNKHSRIVTWHIHVSKQFVCEVKRTESYSCILIFALFLENIGPNCFNVPLFLHLRLPDICKRSCPWFARDSASKFSQISLSWMKHDSAPKIVAWKHKCWVTSRRIPTGSARYIACLLYTSPSPRD